MTTFAELGVAAERAALLAARGIQTPSPIQALSYEPLSAGRDAMLAAQTGSGKTLAYLLPLLARLDAATGGNVITSSQGTHAATPAIVIIVPTQELALQVRDVARSLLEGTGRNVVELIGGANPVRQAEKLKKGADLVVGTAGRMVDFMSRSKLSLLRCRAVVLDEVDQLVDKAHRSDVTSIVEGAPKGRQVVAASATLGDEARRWAGRHMHEPADLQAQVEVQMPVELKHQAIVCDERDQLPTIRKLIAHLNPTGAIAFFNRTNDIDWLVGKLRHHGVRAAGLHSDMTKEARATSMREFRAGKLQLLVATELAARGLDLSGVTIVFNLDLPRGPEHYVHRVGRTARAGRQGTAITLADPKEAWVLEKYEKALALTFERPIYSFGELRDITPVDVRKEAGKAKAKEKKETARSEFAAAVAKAEAEGLPAPRLKKPKKDKTKGPTDAALDKGRMRKLERKAAGTFKAQTGGPAELEAPAEVADATVPLPVAAAAPGKKKAHRKGPPKNPKPPKPVAAVAEPEIEYYDEDDDDDEDDE